ncbi:MAG TPA: beta-ketoacyl-[acyl-carrier-protein] synthase II, partial [Dermatophilaceae bacterium]|nr:beta-ketoacyl-[acyl-carrier-protein] synthase II [Dermatophilaceae bacterium]
MSSDTRVVVTGLGATTPVGGTVPQTWEAILAGRSGARPMEFDWVSRYELPVTFAAQIHTPPEQVLAKVETRRLDPSSQYALIAAREAWADAGSPEVEPERLAVAVGSGIGGVWTLLSQWDTLREKGPRRVYPLAVPMLMPNGPAAAISLDLGARAGAHTPVSACASGAEGMGYAVQLIRSGRADVVIAGGTEAAVHPMPIAGFAAMQALSTRNDDPAAASRPYDTARDGFVLGEGAAIIVLESEAHAKARGARIYAELAGVGMSADAHHITAPEPEGAGASRAMLEAIATAGGTTADVVHINAHATSTPVGDVAEANAIRRAFGALADSIPVSATKSMTGHLLGAAGAVEAIFTILALHHRLAPASINLDTMDPQISLDVVHG